MVAPTAPTLHAFLTSNKRRMEIRILDDEKKPITGIGLTADQLAELIVHLVEIRSQMIPQISVKFPVARSIRVTGTTNYRFSIDPFSGTPLLSFRTPGLGWLTFPLPEAELQRMVRSLSEAKGRMAKPHSNTKQ